MKATSFAAIVSLLTVLNCSRLLAAEDGVALAIIYDTSGSMSDQVRNSDGKMSPKYVIANRALLKIVDQIQQFATNAPGGSTRRIDAGLYIFTNNGPREAVKFGPFDPAALRRFAHDFSKPQGNTPLGNTLNTASKAVLDSPLSRKHVLVITDGINTAGPAPAEVLPAILKRAQNGGASVSVHFVAFDVDAKVFSAVKKQGATVVGATDETQLNAQLDYILQKQILLESEEPTK